MSTAKNTEEQSPSIGGILFCAVIVALVGALLGFLFLASVPPTSFKSVADLQAYLEKNPEPVLLDVSYFEGRISRSRSWEPKRETLLNGSATTVEFTADELNAWMSSKFRNSSPAASGEDAPDIVILPGVPNFFIDEKAGFFFNLPTNLTVYGSAHDCIIMAKGHFSGAQPEFTMDALHANGAAIPLLGGLGDQFVGALLQAYSETDEFVAVQAAWEKVESVELVGDAIRLKLR